MDKALKLMPYDPAWPRDFDAERDRIAAVVGVSAVFPSSGVYGGEAGFHQADRRASARVSVRTSQPYASPFILSAIAMAMGRVTQLQDHGNRAQPNGHTLSEVPKSRNEIIGTVLAILL